MIEFVIPHSAPGLNRLLRMHWQARWSTQKKWTKAIWVERAQVKDPPVWPLPKAWVHIHRQGPKQLDQDNLNGSAKIVLDALKKAQVIEDDSPKHIELVVTQGFGAAQTVIRVEAVC